jgi:hypothetical protein
MFGVETDSFLPNEQSDRRNLPTTYDFAAGASASLNKTITALQRFLQEQTRRPPNGNRDYLYELIADYGERNYRRGFNRGHRESAKNIRNGKVPKVLRYTKHREFFTGEPRTVHLKSTLRKRH